jgi:hypothetical protein
MYGRAWCHCFAGFSQKKAIGVSSMGFVSMKGGHEKTRSTLALRIAWPFLGGPL